MLLSRPAERTSTEYAPAGRAPSARTANETIPDTPFSETESRSSPPPSALIPPPENQENKEDLAERCTLAGIPARKKLLPRSGGDVGDGG